MTMEVYTACFDLDLIPFLGSNRGAVWILFMNRDGTMKNHTKISATQGGFDGILDDNDYFGYSVSWVEDLEGGIPYLAVGAVE